MKKIRKGFTLGEVLICIMVIGIIFALSVQTLKIIRTSYTALSYFAFNNMQAIARELISGQTAKTTESSTILCRRSDGTSVHVLKPDQMEEEAGGVIPSCNQLAVGSGSNTVCKNLVEMSNTTGATNCTNLFTALISEETDEPYISDFNHLNPNYITTNGQRYYITSRAYDARISDEYGFRLIAIDLNGKSKPNTIEKSANKIPPDVITFMLMDNGEVYPLGVAADNLPITGDKTAQYLTARVKGYYYNENSERTSGIPSDCYWKTKDGTIQLCNYAVVPIKNSDTNLAIFSYREAFCASLGQNRTATYADYCYGINQNELCPPSNNEKRFDLCQVETIKPLFRYNL